MKILIVSETSFPSHGGIGRTGEIFATALAGQKQKVVMLTSRAKGQKKIETINGIRLYRFFGLTIPWKNKKTAFVPLPSRDSIRAIVDREKPDIIHVNNPFSILARNTRKVAHKKNIPIIATFHFQPENVTALLNLNYEIINKKIMEFFVGSLEKYEALTVPTTFGKKLLIKYGFKKRVEIVSNCVNINIKKDKKLMTTLRKKYNIKNKKLILFVGRVMKDKNIKFLIDCFPLLKRKIKDLALVIVGDGEEKEKLIELTENEKNIIFTGRLAQKELDAMYSTCDLFALASIVELQGMVVMEAMAAGKPIMVAKTPSSAAYLLVDGNGYTFKLNEKDFVQKAAKILSNDKLAKKMGKKSIEIIKQFETSKVTKRLIEFYKKEIKKQAHIRKI